jgi:Mn2+/Fe2+ NRAMP family transporter
MGVLLAGMAFGVADVRPVPVIILAQAFNGLLLPLVAVFLLATMNDRELLGGDGVNSWAQNVVMLLVVVVCVVLGFRGLAAAAKAALYFLGGS